MHINIAEACREAVRDPLEASSLPPEMYLDPEIFATERDRVFGRSWLSVARTEDLAEVGDYVTYDAAGDPVVVVRGQGGLRAFSNVCLHRNTTIMEGSGRVRALQCPYHLWTYGLDGQLVGTPSMDQAVGFDRTELCLPELLVETWQGWVFVNFDPQAKPLATQIAGLDERLAGFDLSALHRVGTLHYPSPWNWKITVENFSESYHHGGIHPETLHQPFPGHRSWVEDNGGQPWIWLDHTSVVPDVTPFKVGIVFPTHLFAVTPPGSLVWFKLQVRSHDHLDLDIDLYLSDEWLEDAEATEDYLERITKINDEDVAINKRTQAGFRSRLARPGRLSHLELATWQFRRWLVDRLASSS